MSDFPRTRTNIEDSLVLKRKDHRKMMEIDPTRTQTQTLTHMVMLKKMRTTTGRMRKMNEVMMQEAQAVITLEMFIFEAA